MSPDEVTLRADLAGTRYLVNEFRGKWKLVSLEFPIAMFRVRAAAKPGCPPWLLLRLDCQGYRGVAPTGQLWSGLTNAALEPQMRPHTAGGIMTAFQEWGKCLYHPIDRLARDHWPGQHAELAWSNDKDINSYLEVVYDLLHDSQYAYCKAEPASAYLPGESLAANSA